MTASSQGGIAILIPAAGASRRLGRPKQLELFEGQTLLRRAAKRASEAKVGPVLVVLGHRAAECAAELDGLNTETIFAPDWQEGMGATIRAGVAWAQARPDIAGVLITLADQWQLTTNDLLCIAAASRNASTSIVAARYADTLGPPALFPRTAYAELLALQGDEGARRLLRAHPERVIAVDLPHAEADWDEVPGP